MSLKSSVATKALPAQALRWIGRQSDCVGSNNHPATLFLHRLADLHRAGRTCPGDDDPAFPQTGMLSVWLEAYGVCILISSDTGAAAEVMSTPSRSGRVVVLLRLHPGLRDWLLSRACCCGVDVSETDHVDIQQLETVPEARPAQTGRVEPPAKPFWHISDIRAITGLAHDCAVLVVVDNVASTPVLTRQLGHGIVVVLHSGNGDLNGHADGVASALMWNAKEWNFCGDSLTPATTTAQSWGNSKRGFCRVACAHANCTNVICPSALEITALLQERESVREILYRRVTSQPVRALAREQMRSSSGGAMSFHVKGEEDAALQPAASPGVLHQTMSSGRPETVLKTRRVMESP